jgi:hypothetical protein
VQLTPRDAQMFWLSERIGNDQFQLYCFDEVADTPEMLRAGLLDRARRIPDLRLRVREVPRHLDYPYWVGGDVAPEQVVTHARVDDSWTGCAAAVAALLTDRLDARVHAWRVHLFCGVRGAPRCTGPAVVAVLQISHALADGRHATTLARLLFRQAEPATGPGADPRALPGPLAVARGLLRLPVRIAGTLVRGVRAERARRRLAELAQHGRVPPEVPGCPLLSVNAAPGPTRQVRMIVLPAARLRGPRRTTVTVAVLTAVAAALSAYEPVAPRGLGAEVTVAYQPVPARLFRKRSPRNSFGNVGVNLYPGEPDPARRAAKIAAALADRRVRLDHPLQRIRRAVTDGLPAQAMWRELTDFPLDLVPATMTGNTVVSSVFRGPADLDLGGGRVRFTAGFPALSPFMALTHGVHGIGDTVTITLAAGPAAVPDLDRYHDLLLAALDTPS